MKASSWDACAGRNLYIDMLRGASIVLVMLLHFSLSYRLVSTPLQEWVPASTLHAIFYNGNYGVSIFFVISGFLITSNILARYGSLAGVDIAHFYKLRFFRLYPLVVLAVVIITALGGAGLPKFSNIAHHVNLGKSFFFVADLSVLTFWHNVLMERVGYFNYALNIYWSLSVEEVFYLLYPLVLVCVRRRWQLLLLAFAGIIGAPLYRAMHKHDELFYLYGNLACVDMLACGCMAALIAAKARMNDLTRRIIAFFACIAMGWVYMRGIHGHEALGATLLGVSTAIFLVAVSRLQAGLFSRASGGALAWLGSRSYELYLFHIVVLGIMVEWVPAQALSIERKWPMFGLFFVLSAMLAWMVARWLGDPLNQWLRRRYAHAGSSAHFSSRFHRCIEIIPRR